MEKRNIREKVTLIVGDCSLPELGISDEDYETLCKNVTHIFHAAALLNMDEHLRKAFIVNVSATETLLKMAKKMNHLKVNCSDCVFSWVEECHTHTHLSLIHI